MASSDDDVVLAFRDVWLSFDRPILRGVSFELRRGATHIILGGSGSGKTTILRLILGLLKPDSGTITVDDEPVSSLSEEELRRVRLRLGMVFQEGALFDSLSVADNVGFRLHEDAQLGDETIAARVRELLGFVGLGSFHARMPSELSGGQRRRVAVARALAARPEIMLYDEPTTGLDPITATTITDLIVKARDIDRVSSILVTHQLRDAFNVARTVVEGEGEGARLRVLADDGGDDATDTRFLMLREGQVVFEGSAGELRRSRDPYIVDFLS